MLKGKWALVTGATAGLGLAIAESLAGAGANIVLHDLVEPKEASEHLRKRFEVDVVSVAADLSQRTSIEAMMADLLGRLDAIDILVNNAVVRHFAPVVIGSDSFVANQFGPGSVSLKGQVLRQVGSCDVPSRAWLLHRAPDRADWYRSRSWRRSSPCGAWR